MAYTNTAVPSDESGWAAADKLLMFSGNIVDANTSIRWNETGDIADTARTNSDYPESNGHDGFLSIETKPSGVASNSWHYIFQLPSTVEYDGLAIFGHNFATIGGTPALNIYIADDGAFTTNLANIYRLDPLAASKRIVTLELDVATGEDRISGSHFVRLQISNAGGPNFVPQFTELVLFRRRQFKHNPNRPWGKDDTFNIEDVFVGGVGNRIVHVDAERLRRLNGTVQPSETALIADIVSLRDDSLGFSLPIGVIQRPNTAPTDLLWMWKTGQNFEFPENGPFDRTWSFLLEEDGDLPLQQEL